MAEVRKMMRTAEATGSPKNERDVDEKQKVLIMAVSE